MKNYAIQNSLSLTKTGKKIDYLHYKPLHFIWGDLSDEMLTEGSKVRGRGEKDNKKITRKCARMSDKSENDFG